MTLQPFTKTTEHDDRVYKLPDGRLAKKLATLGNGELLMQVLPDEPTIEKSAPLPPTPEQVAHLERVYEKAFPTPSATEQLDTLTADYAKTNNVDRPTARVAVLKSAAGRKLYAESVGRAPAATTVKAPKPLTKSAADYEAELAAFAKSKGIRLADAMKTTEGRAIYNLSIRARRDGGAR